MSYTVKPQTPLMLGDNFIYPLTAADQVVVGAGTENERRLEVGGKVEADHAVEADSLSGKSLSDIMLMVYPVGSIYMSMNAVNPQTLFGGTWEKLKDRFLLGAGDTYELGATGGEAEHTLTVGEMPSHIHTYAGKPANDTYTWAAPNMRVEYVYTADNPYPANVASSSVGGSQPHNNMPPYLTVNMWKRTA